MTTIEAPTDPLAPSPAGSPTGSPTSSSTTLRRPRWRRRATIVRRSLTTITIGACLLLGGFAHAAGDRRLSVVAIVAAMLGTLSDAVGQHQREALRADALDDFATSLERSILHGDPLQELLVATRGLVASPVAWLVVADEGGQTIVQEANGGEHHVWDRRGFEEDMLVAVGALPVPGVIRSTTRDGNGRRLRTIATSVPTSLPGDTILVAARRRFARPFSSEERRLLVRIAIHAGSVIECSRMLGTLRSESEDHRHHRDHDPLTGLANRALFRRSLETSLERGRTAGVLLIDLDRFKEVNDTLGHHNGDVLLAEAALRMARALGPEILLARLGGDEFAAFVDGDVDELGLRLFANEVRAAMLRPFRLRDVQIDVGASVGVAPARAFGDSVGDLLRRADVAMYAAKRDRSGVEVYNEVVDDHSKERLEIVPRLRSAIERSELAMHYQPQLDLRTGEVVGVEALLRWPEMSRRLTTETVLSVAEQTDLMRPLTRYVMTQVVRQCAQWRTNDRSITVSVNVSARNLLEPDLVEFTARLLDRAGVPRSHLRIELTETALMAPTSRTAEVLRAFQSNGIGIALDDFGTGHSSLTHLMTLPVDEVKIDRSFVLALESDPIAGRVAHAIVDLGSSLGLDVVAEGVETSEQLVALRAMGCSRAQGYYFARPMEASRFCEWLDDRWAPVDAGATHEDRLERGALRVVAEAGGWATDRSDPVLPPADEFDGVGLA